MLSLFLPFFQKLPEHSNLSLRDQICELVTKTISSKAISPNIPLPSCRELAEQLGVSRNTVFAAYSRLIDLEMITARDRSGYFVNASVFSNTIVTDNLQPKNAYPESPVSFSKSQLIPLDNPLNWRNFDYPFIYNQIDPDLFPVDAWRECSRLALGRRHMPQWTGDSVESDSPHLIEQIRQRLLISRGIVAAENEILITLGAQNAFSIIGALFSSFKQPIAIENPGYFGAINAFRMTGNQLVPAEVDREGIVPSSIPDGVKLVFTTPSHQFPTMITMSTRRRQEFLEAADKKDFIVIEDDYEAEINFMSKASPSLRSIDRNQRVIYIGSFSKTISPGIRIGYIVAHRDIIKQARLVRGTMFRHPPTIVQEVIALFIRLGYFDAHLRKLERRYKRRWNAMRDSIGEHLHMLKRFENNGGTSFWFLGSEGFDANLLRDQLRKRSVLVDRGQNYYLERNKINGMRLGFALVPVDKIDSGIRLIAEEVKKLL